MSVADSRTLAREEQRLLDLLKALGSTTFRQLLWQRASSLDLPYAQPRVLFYVSPPPECHMGAVAKAFGVTLPAVTHIIDRLEQKDFVVRGDDPADRQVYALELTAQGKALVRELHTMQTRGLEEVLTRMSADDRHRGLKGLEAPVEAGAGAVGGGGPAPPRRRRRRRPFPSAWRPWSGRWSRCRWSRWATCRRTPRWGSSPRSPGRSRRCTSPRAGRSSAATSSSGSIPGPSRRLCDRTKPTWPRRP